MSSSAQQAATTLPLAPGRWPLDPAHSSVVFSVRHLGLSKVWGRFENFDAVLDVGTTQDEVTVEATIDMASVNTSNADRDAHLRSTDFFDTEQHPTMHFRSATLSGDGSEWVLDGELTINGITRPVTLDIEYNGLAPFPPPDGNLHAGFTAAGELKRSDFGIDFGMLPIGADKLALSDKVKFELDLQFVEPQA
ncbi:MAG: YceI family protein [Acidimicrobiales bacterium]|jgi:polyisoprenoid-binding protein YceI|nr:YceI family protein [Acidimicrobiales bacterium]